VVPAWQPEILGASYSARCSPVLLAVLARDRGPTAPTCPHVTCDCNFAIPVCCKMIDAVSCHHRSWNKARSPQKHVQQILLALLLLSHILAAPTVFIYVQNNIMLQPKEACALYSKQKKAAACACRHKTSWKHEAQLVTLLTCLTHTTLMTAAK
jgi:hypothetical protein